MRKVEEIAIGWSLEAALFAFRKGCPLFVVSDKQESIRDFLKSPFDYDSFRIDPNPVQIDTNYGSFHLEAHKREITNCAHFFVGLMGNLFRGTIQIDNNIIQFRGRHGYVQEFDVQKIYIFNIENIPQIEGLNIIESKFETFDYIKLHAHTKYDLLFSGYKKYCQEIWLCNSFDGWTDVRKDGVVVSIFDSLNEAHDPDNSSHLISLMAKDILEENEVDHKKFNHIERDIIEKIKWSCEDYGNFIFSPNMTVEEIEKIDLSRKTRESIWWFGNWKIAA